MSTEAPFTPIAVVGAGAIFPGTLDVAGFWHNILAKKDLIREVPPGHWLLSDYYDPDPKAPDMTYAKRGAFLPDVPFDAMGFGIPPSILPATDTSQLLALIVAKMVLDDVSDHQADKLDTSRISVILGVTGAQELLSSLVSRLQHPVWERSLRGMGMDEATVKEACARIASHYVPWQESSFPGLLGNVVAGRIANRLNLGGTNCITDAACASALAAVHLAINELRLGQSDMVVTGGVDTLNDIFMHMCFSKTPALSPTGDCRPFDESGDGTLLGEGLGMLALKRLDDAERDNDHIYAVIRGIGTSSDGRSKSVYAPVPEGQARALKKAYEVAGYGPDTVELLEAHGTATKAGDAAEIKGLKQVFETPIHRDTPRTDRQWCALGSIKSQIGHTKAAAGAAGLMKIVLALHHKVLPPTIKVKKPTPSADFPNSPFYVNTEARPWIRGPEHPRRASVSSFGFGGSNFHITCEEYLGPARRPARIDPSHGELLLFSANTDAELVAQLEAARGQDVVKLAYKTQKEFDGKKPCRMVVMVEQGLDAAIDKALVAMKEGSSRNHRGACYRTGGPLGKVAFLFPGQGSQYLDMAKDLAMTYDAAREAYDAAEAAVPGLAMTIFPRPTFTPEDRAKDEATLVRTEWAQPAIGATSAAMLAMLKACGVTAEATAGHSFGELTALWAAGALSFSDWMTAARKRGVLMAAASEIPGAMAAVTAPADQVAPHLPEGVSIANYNAPEQTVIAGSVEAVKEARERLKAAGLRATKLPVSTAFHSPLVAPAAAEFAEYLKGVAFSAPTMPVWSNTTGAVHTAEDLGAALGAHLANPVRFIDEIESMYAAGVRVFIEVGPGAVLTGLVNRILGDRPHEAFSTDAKGRDGVTSLHAALGRAAALGLPVDFAPLWAQREASPMKAPAPKMAVDINGTNYGKPWPTPKGEGPVQAPWKPAVAAKPVSPPIVQSPSKEDAPVKNGVHTHPIPAAESAPAPVAPAPAPAPVQAAPAWGPNPWVTAFQESQRQMADVQESFTRSMAEAHIAFLRTHEESTRGLVSLLTGQPLPAAQPWAPALSAPVHTAPAPAPIAYAAPAPVAYAAPAPVAYAAPAPVAYAPPVAPAPVAPAPVAYVAPVAPAPAPIAAAPVAPAPAAPKAPARDLTKVLLEVVGEKTGYPVEMLNLEMNLEADLGIDSIKRVEILSALRERAPETPEVDADKMAQLKTLGQIVGFLGDNAPAAAAAPAPVKAAAPAGRDLTKVLLEVVGEKTGYPVEMLNLEMNLEADLGIDSIKRVEILSALRERAPETPEVDADKMAQLKTLGQIVGFLGENAPAAAPKAPTATKGADPTRLLLEVVGEKTGYPTEMLNLDMNLEADLGIDSIKRVEILSALRERAPETPEVDADKMAQLKTLGQIVAFLGEKGTSLPFDGGGDSAVLPLPPAMRQEVFVVPLPAGTAVGIGPVAVVPDDQGVAERLVERLQFRGVDAVVRRVEELTGDRGVIFLGGLRKVDVNGAIATSKEAFRAAKQAALGVAWVTVTAQGGDFGLGGAPSQADAILGGLAGFTKTVALEYPGSFVRAIDLAPADPDTLVAWLDAELSHQGPVEVGVTAEGRTTLEARDIDIPQVAPDLGPDDVLVVSGGARGVTAACLITLARACRPKLVLLGRSRIDTPEAPEVAAAKDEPGIKRALFGLEKGLPPAELGRRASAILAAREARGTVAALEKYGSVVRYLAVDVQDAAALSKALAKVRAELGPITGVVHGAGVIQDKRIAEKSPASFDAVYDTKIAGAFALLAATEQDPLRTICFFSSVAARGGNVGQCDYAMANEALNKLAAAEAKRRPGAIVKSIGWGPWEGGMVTPALAKQFAAMGVPLLPIDVGAQMFVAELARRDAIEIVVGGMLQPRATKGKEPLTRPVSARQYPFLKDHAIAGNPVFPVVLALEWFVQRARELRPGLVPVAVRDVKVLKGITLGAFDGAGDKLEVIAEDAGSNQLKMEIRTPGGPVHYRATVEVASAPPARPAAPAPVVGAAYGHEPRDIYGRFLFHGPGFQVIRQVVGASESGMEAVLTGTHDIGWTVNGWQTDLAAFDGGLQLALLWNRMFTDAASLPTGIGALLTYGAPAPGVVRCVLTGKKRSGRSVVSDLSFVDSAGRVFAELRGVETHALASATFPTAQRAEA